MKVTVTLSTWYAKGNVAEDCQIYAPYLRNGVDERCCLGFACEAHGVEPSAMTFLTEPHNLGRLLPSENWMVEDASNSELARLAIYMNDAKDSDGDWSKEPLEVRMGNLITVFLEGGDELEFVP